MSISQRKVLKEIVKFAKREFREKKPLNLRVLRVKDERIASRGGPLPNLIQTRTHTPYYHVVLNYGEEYRVYNFSKRGVLIDGKNFLKGSKEIKVIEKTTKVEYKLE
jgi:hypothetical protein